MSIRFKIPALLLAALAAALLFGATLPKKPIKGELLQNSTLAPDRNGTPHCRVDSGAGTILYLQMDYENDLFAAGAHSKLHLRVHFSENISPGQRFTLPAEGLTVCYQEVGDLLLFESFTGKGWIQFDKLDDKKASGKLDLKLVQPHHNMSNSDYHYMGGDFKVSVR